MASESTTPPTSARNDDLLYRLATLPLVNDALNKIVSSYEAAKQMSPTVESTLTTFEQNVQYASEKAKPVYERYLQGSADLASRVACRGLDRVEEKYPGVKMTPEELQECYDKSSMKQGVDKTWEYGAQKIDQSNTYYQELLANLLGYGTSTLNGSLDYCDDMINKYLAEGTTEQETVNAGEDTYMKRAQMMGAKATTGLRQKAKQQADNAKLGIQKVVADLRGAMELIEHFKSTPAGQSATHFVGNVAALKDSLEEKAKQYNVEPQTLLLRSIKLSSAMLSSASEILVKHTADHLSGTVKSSLEAASAYLHYLDQTLAEAKSLTDVKDELVSEAKDNMKMAEQGLLGALQKFSDYPPLKRLITNLTNARPEESVENVDEN